MILTRRNLLRGLVAAPAIIAVERLMPVRLWKPERGIIGVGGTFPEVWPVLNPASMFGFTHKTYSYEIDIMGNEVEWIRPLGT